MKQNRIIKILGVGALLGILTLFSNHQYRKGAEESCVYFTSHIGRMFGFETQCSLITNGNYKKFLIILINPKTGAKAYIDSQTGELVDENGKPLENSEADASQAISF